MQVLNCHESRIAHSLAALLAALIQPRLINSPIALQTGMWIDRATFWRRPKLTVKSRQVLRLNDDRFTVCHS